MTLLLLIFGAATGSLLSILVGLLGSRRRIGFGLSFIISILLTPLVGLIVTLLSSPMEYGDKRGVGCLGTILAIVGFLFLLFILPVVLAFFGLGASLLIV